MDTGRVLREALVVDEPLRYNIERDDYSGFIGRLRDRLANEKKLGLDWLISQEACPNQCLDIELTVPFERTGEEYSITVRVYKANLYVLGYKVGKADSDEPFWEFSDAVPNIKNANSLGINGSYEKLPPRKNTTLGYNALVFAVSGLAKKKLEDNMVRKALLILIQMISESARFKRIEAFIVENWTKGKILDQPLIDIQNSWEDISAGLLKNGENYLDTMDHELVNVRLKAGGIQKSDLGILLLAKQKVKGAKMTDTRAKSRKGESSSQTRG